MPTKIPRTILRSSRSGVRAPPGVPLQLAVWRNMLGIVQLADKVAVFDDGWVAEYGTHAELYAKGGIYTEMFDKQAQFYRDEAPATQNAQG